MNLIGLPDPVSMWQTAKDGSLERAAANALMSAMYSTWIALTWRSGAAKWADWTGEGQALKDAATAMYLSLGALEKKGFLTLTVPKDLLDPNNLAKFQTEYQTK